MNGRVNRRQVAASVSVLNKHSLANKYVVEALENGNGVPSENGSGVPSENAMVSAFEAMDELIPQLGVYSKIFAQLRNDFFDAIYSKQLTGHKSTTNDVGESGERFIQKIPYFTLVQRVNDARDTRAEELTTQLDTVKEKLFDKCLHAERSEQKIADLEALTVELQGRVQEVEGQLNDKSEQYDKLEEARSQDNSMSADSIHQLTCDVTEYKVKLEEAQAEVTYLLQFKKTYDGLDSAFRDIMDNNVYRRKPAISTKRANLISQLQSAQKLETQLLTVMNATLEEYDQFLESYKLETLSAKQSDWMMNEMADMGFQSALDNINEQRSLMQANFCKSMENLGGELELLRQHMTMLQEQLQILEEGKPQTIQKSRRNRTKPDIDGMDSVQYNREDSMLSAGLSSTAGEDADMDPFIPQERVFSKYAAMVYTSSNDGKSFLEMPQAKYCPSCGEKTVICPHKLGGSEKVFMLPKNCSHIKISRPKVRINQELIDEIINPADGLSSNYPLSDNASQLNSFLGHTRKAGSSPLVRAQSEYQAQPVIQSHEDIGALPESPMLTGDGDLQLHHPLSHLWEDYRERTTLDRVIARPLDKERLLSVIEQFCAHLLYQDDNGYDSNNYQSVNDNFHQFLCERYQIEDAVFSTAYDIIIGILQFQEESLLIQLFGHVLVGNLDATCLRYILIMADFIDAVTWQEMDHFGTFAATVYPFLSEDDLESFQMTYTSFSENKIVPQLIINFIINCILKNKEPCFTYMRSKVLALQSSDSDSSILSEAEFVEIFENLVPLCTDKQRMQLYWEAALQGRSDGIDGISVDRTSQIVSYANLQQVSGIMRDNVRRQINGDAPARSVASLPPSPSTDPALLTIHRVRELANNVGRYRKFLFKQSQNEAEDADIW